MKHRMFATAAAAFALTGLFATGMPLRAEVIEQVLVKVNGEIVSKSEFEQRQVATLGSRPEFAGGKASNAELQKAIAEITPDLILEMVDELLLIQRGRELNFALGDKQFQEILDDIKKRNNITDEAQFQAELKQSNMTEADLRRQIERSMLIQQVQSQEVTQKLAVTDEEARADIGRRVISGKSQAALQGYLDRLRAQATISFKNAELEKAYNQALTKRRAAVAATPAA